MKLYARLAALLIAICCLNTLANAQQYEPGYVLSGEMNEAKSKGIVFKPYSLFNTATATKHTTVLRKETLLTPDKAAISQLYNEYPRAIALTLKTDDGQTFVLDMMQSSPLSAEPKMSYIDAQGTHPCSYEKGAHYQGAVRANAKSAATMSVFANGDVMILFANADGNYVAGKIEDNSGLYILYNDKDFIAPPPTKCGTKESMTIPRNGTTQTANKTTAAYGCNKVRMYWEADYDLYRGKSSSVTSTQNYLSSLFNQVQTMYRNEKIAIELHAVSVWTIADGIREDASENALIDYQAMWNNKGDTFSGDIAMFMALDKTNLGGIAYLGVLCNRSFSYAYGNIYGNYQTVPTFSWDVEMTTHEHGHNLGSNHTHWCGWNTGGGGTCGAIDNCSTLEAVSGCSTCPYTYDDALPNTAWSGSVMSYCHTVARGISLANGFGPLPGNKIRTEVAGASCLESIISAKLTQTPICKGKGAITLTYNTATIGSKNFGAAPFTYSWSNGGKTQNLTSLSTPGIYSVTITDSNGCSKAYNITLTTNTADSCKTVSGSVSSVASAPQYVSLYPNPAHQNFSMKFYTDKTTAVSIKVVDVVGKTTFAKPYTTKKGENDVTVDINGWTKGVYFVQIQSVNEEYETVKLVVE